jgi:hypothetical protein
MPVSAISITSRACDAPRSARARSSTRPRSVN